MRVVCSMYPISMDELHPSVPSDWHVRPCERSRSGWRSGQVVAALDERQVGDVARPPRVPERGGWSVNRKRDNRYGVPGD